MKARRNCRLVVALAASNGRLTLVLEPVTVKGGQMTLEPRGPVELVRQTPQGPGAFRL
jgi:hypothetical protein